MPRAQPKTLSDTLKELWELLRAYAKQETVEPLRGLGRYLAAGIGGAVLIALGVVLLGLGTLRVLQEEAASTFDGVWSFGPYAIVFGASLAVIAIAGSRIRKEPKRRI